MATWSKNLWHDTNLSAKKASLVGWTTTITLPGNNNNKYQTMVATKRASIGGGGTFSVGLHTDQQSLILGEMMTARNKLQEENQILRDKLQDSEMIVRILQHKLTENKIDFDITKKFGIMVDDLPVVTNKVNRKPMEKTKTNLLPVSNKNSFRNKVAPGKKTFESKAIKKSFATGPLSKFNAVLPQSPKSRSVLLHTMSCSPDSRFAVQENTRPTTTSGRSVPHHIARNKRKGDIATSINMKLGTKSNTNIGTHSTGTRGGQVHCFGEEQFPGDAQQMRSVIGKLAQVVINEYSTTDDDEENMIFE